MKKLNIYYMDMPAGEDFPMAKANVSEEYLISLLNGDLKGKFIQVEQFLEGGNKRYLAVDRIIEIEVEE